MESKSDFVSDLNLTEEELICLRRYCQQNSNLNVIRMNCFDRYYSGFSVYDNYDYQLECSQKCISKYDLELDIENENIRSIDRRKVYLFVFSYFCNQLKVLHLFGIDFRKYKILNILNKYPFNSLTCLILDECDYDINAMSEYIQRKSVSLKHLILKYVNHEVHRETHSYSCKHFDDFLKLKPESLDFYESSIDFHRIKARNIPNNKDLVIEIIFKPYNQYAFYDLNNIPEKMFVSQISISNENSYFDENDAIVKDICEYFPNLVTLELRMHLISSDNFSDISKLSKLKNLVLILDHCLNTTNDLCLMYSRGLRVGELKEFDDLDESFNILIEKCPNIETCVFKNVANGLIPLSDISLKNIKMWKNLRVFSIDLNLDERNKWNFKQVLHQKITNAFLYELENSYIERLELWNCNITDEGIKNFLIKNSNLNSLDIINCPKVTHVIRDYIEEERFNLKYFIPIIKINPRRLDLEITAEKMKEILYFINKEKNGVCIIIVNTEFKAPNVSSRIGAEKDAKLLKYIFQDLGFEVVYRTNLTNEQMFKLLFENRDKIIENPDENLAFVLIISSHGGVDEVYSIDECEKDYRINVHKIFNIFNCDALEEKPKLIIIRACRGTKEGTNIRVFGNDGYSENDNFLRTDSQLVHNLMKYPSKNFRTISRNFFICYASVLGEVAYRDSTNRTEFGLNLAEEMIDNIYYKSFEEILINVSNRMCAKMQSFAKDFHNSGRILRFIHNRSIKAEFRIDEIISFRKTPIKTVVKGREFINNLMQSRKDEFKKINEIIKVMNSSNIKISIKELESIYEECSYCVPYSFIFGEIETIISIIKKKIEEKEFEVIKICWKLVFRLLSSDSNYFTIKDRLSYTNNLENFFEMKGVELALDSVIFFLDRNLMEIEMARFIIEQINDIVFHEYFQSHTTDYDRTEIATVMEKKEVAAKIRRLLEKLPISDDINREIIVDLSDIRSIIEVSGFFGEKFEKILWEKFEQNKQILTSHSSDKSLKLIKKIIIVLRRTTRLYSWKIGAKWIIKLLENIAAFEEFDFFDKLSDDFRYLEELRKFFLIRFGTPKNSGEVFEIQMLTDSKNLRKVIETARSRSFNNKGNEGSKSDQTFLLNSLNLNSKTVMALENFINGLPENMLVHIENETWNKFSELRTYNNRHGSLKDLYYKPLCNETCVSQCHRIMIFNSFQDLFLPNENNYTLEAKLFFYLLVKLEKRIKNLDLDSLIHLEEELILKSLDILCFPKVECLSVRTNFMTDDMAGKLFKKIGHNLTHLRIKNCLKLNIIPEIISCCENLIVFECSHFQKFDGDLKFSNTLIDVNVGVDDTFYEFGIEDLKYLFNGFKTSFPKVLTINRLFDFEETIPFICTRFSSLTVLQIEFYENFNFDVLIDIPSLETLFIKKDLETSRSYKILNITSFLENLINKSKNLKELKIYLDRKILITQSVLETLLESKLNVLVLCVDKQRDPERRLLKPILLPETNIKFIDEEIFEFIKDKNLDILNFSGCEVVEKNSENFKYTYAYDPEYEEHDFALVYLKEHEYIEGVPHFDDNVYYKMSSYPRGQFLMIFNFESANKKLELKLKVEAQSLRDTFKELGFITIIKYNRTVTEILSDLRECRKNSCKEDDAIIVYIYAKAMNNINYIRDVRKRSNLPLVDGNRDIFIDKNNESIKIQDIKDMFNNENFPTMRLKPKILIFDKQLVDEKTKVKPIEPIDCEPLIHPHITNTEERGNVVKEIPSNSDLFILESNTPYNYDLSRGTMNLISSLKTTLESYSRIETMTEMFIRVIQLVDKEIDIKDSSVANLKPRLPLNPGFFVINDKYVLRNTFFLSRKKGETDCFIKTKLFWLGILGSVLCIGSAYFWRQFKLFITKII